jgi:hypothetical protein
MLEAICYFTVGNISEQKVRRELLVQRERERESKLIGGINEDLPCICHFMYTTGQPASTGSFFICQKVPNGL